MIRKLLVALLRFAHSEAWLLKLADYLDGRQDFVEVEPHGFNSAE